MVEEDGPDQYDEEVDGEQSREVGWRDAQDVADQERGEFREAAASAHDHESDGNGGRGEYANDGVCRCRRPMFDVGDEEGKGDREDDECGERRDDADERADGNARKCTVAERVREERHAA